MDRPIRHPPNAAPFGAVFFFLSPASPAIRRAQLKIQEAVNASAQGLAEAKTHLARAYNLAVENIALRGLILKPMSGEALDAFRSGVRTAEAAEIADRQGGEYAANTTIDLLHLVATAELLEKAQDAISSGLAAAWAEGAKPDLEKE